MWEKLKYIFITTPIKEFMAMPEWEANIYVLLFCTLVGILVAYYEYWYGECGKGK